MILDNSRWLWRTTRKTMVWKIFTRSDVRHSPKSYSKRDFFSRIPSEETFNCNYFLENIWTTASDLKNCCKWISLYSNPETYSFYSKMQRYVTLHYITFYLLVTESRTVSLSYLLIISVSKKLSTDLISLAQAHFVIKLSPVIIKPEAFCNSFMSHFVIKWLSAFRNNICHFDFQQQIALCLMPCTCHAQRVLAFFLTRKSVQLPSF